MMKYQCNPLARLGMTAMLLIAAVALSPADPVELVSPNAQEDGRFGMNVAGLEDVNGDGKGDVVIGAGSEDGLTSLNIGHAYVFDGSTGNVIRTLESPNAESGGRFGCAVSGVPDISGDGRPEIIVGARGEDKSLIRGWGRVYVVNGATGNLITTISHPDRQEGQAGTGNFGHVVTGLPDVSGDGKGDVVVGEMLTMVGLWPEVNGGAFIFDGSTGSMIHRLTCPIEESNNHFATTLSGIEDVNGDNKGDLVVGAQGLETGGKAYIYSGASGSIIRTLTSPNAESGGSFGCSVSSIPDVNSDGKDDIIVGAPYESTSGRAYIINSANGNVLQTLVSPDTLAEDAYFGEVVSGIPDYNGDGKGDVVVSVTGRDIIGCAYIFDGATGDLLQKIESTHEKASTSPFGSSVSGVPDVTGNGACEVIVGSPKEDVNPTSAGRAYIFYGGASNVGQWRSY